MGGGFRTHPYHGMDLKEVFEALCAIKTVPIIAKTLGNKTVFRSGDSSGLSPRVASRLLGALLCLGMLLGVAACTPRAALTPAPTASPMPSTPPPQVTS